MLSNVSQNSDGALTHYELSFLANGDKWVIDGNQLVEINKSNGVIVKYNAGEVSQIVSNTFQRINSSMVSDVFPNYSRVTYVIEGEKWRGHRFSKAYLGVEPANVQDHGPFVYTDMNNRNVNEYFEQFANYADRIFNVWAIGIQMAYEELSEAINQDIQNNYSPYFFNSSAWQTSSSANFSGLDNFISFASNRALNPANASSLDGTDLGVSAVSSKLREILSSESISAQEYSSDGVLETQTYTNSNVMIFDDEGRPEELFTQSGLVSIQYFYDNEGQLSRVYLKKAREDVDNQIQRILDQLSLRKQDALIDLAVERGVIGAQLKQAFDSGRAQFESTLAQLNRALSDLEGTKVKGKDAKRQKSEALDELRRQIIRVQQEYIQFTQQQMQANEQLAQRFNTLEAEIHSQYEINVTAVDQKEQELHRQVILQEISPIIYNAFRKSLGRDPATSEYQFFADQVDYASGAGVSALKTREGHDFNAFVKNDIQSRSAELEARQTYVSHVQQKVSDLLRQYLSLTPEQRIAFAATLQLTYDPANPFLSDIKEISASDVDRILQWLNTRSLHFGQSAFLSLEKLLDQAGVSYNREELAARAILIDILSGVITPIDDGELVLSVFALAKTAKTYGVELQGGKNISWSDLVAIFQNNPNERVIVHINGNHFVVVTGISNDQITYIDMGIGKDKENESVTISKAEFLKGFRGNILIQNTALQALPNNSEKMMSRDDAQKVRGAFFGLIFVVIAAVAAVAVTVGLIIAAILLVVAQVIILIATILAAVLVAIGQIVYAIGSAIYAGISYAASTLYHFGQTMFATVSSQAGFGAASKLSFGQFLFRQAVITGVSFATSKGLEAAGVDPMIAGLVSAFVTGGVAGGLNAGFSFGHVVTGSIQGVVVHGTQIGLQAAGVDPALAGILAGGITAIGTGVMTGTFRETIVRVAPQLTKQLTFYGVSKLGEEIGIEPEWAPLFNGTVSGMINGTFSPDQFTPKIIFDSVMAGMKEGALSVAINFAEEKLDLDPLLAAATIRGVSGAIEGALSPGHNALQGMVQALQSSVLHVATGGGSPGQDPYAQVLYLQRVLRLSDAIRTQGLARALQDNAASILKADAIQSLARSFGSIEKWIQDALQNPERFRIETINGKTHKILSIDADTEIGFSESLDDVSFMRRGREILEGKFGIDEAGKWGLITGIRQETFATGGRTVSQIQNGNVTRIQVYSPEGVSSGKVSSTIVARNEETGIQVDTQGNLWDGEFSSDDFRLTMRSGFIEHFEKLIFELPQNSSDNREPESMWFRMTRQTDGSYNNSVRFQIQNATGPTFFGLDHAGETYDYRGSVANIGGLASSLRLELEGNNAAKDWFDHLRIEAGELLLGQGLGQLTDLFGGWVSFGLDVIGVSKEVENTIIPNRTVSNVDRRNMLEALDKFSSLLRSSVTVPQNYAHVATIYDPSQGEQAFNSVFEALFSKIPIIGNLEIPIPENGDLVHVVRFETIDGLGFRHVGQLEVTFGDYLEGGNSRHGIVGTSIEIYRSISPGSPILEPIPEYVKDVNP